MIFSNIKIDLAVRRKGLLSVLYNKLKFNAIRVLLEEIFEKTFSISKIQQQHCGNVLHKDLIEYASYLTREEKYVFRFEVL
jgi:hypothetical protein